MNFRLLAIVCIVRIPVALIRQSCSISENIPAQPRKPKRVSKQILRRKGHNVPVLIPSFSFHFIFHFDFFDWMHGRFGIFGQIKMIHVFLRSSHVHRQLYWDACEFACVANCHVIRSSCLLDLKCKHMTIHLIINLIKLLSLCIFGSYSLWKSQQYLSICVVWIHWSPTKRHVVLI